MYNPHLQNCINCKSSNTILNESNLNTPDIILFKFYCFDCKSKFEYKLFKKENKIIEESNRWRQLMQ